MRISFGFSPTAKLREYWLGEFVLMMFHGPSPSLVLVYMAPPEYELTTMVPFVVVLPPAPIEVQTLYGEEEGTFPSVPLRGLPATALKLRGSAEILK